MTIRDYEEICLKFAEETREWGGLDESQQYTTVSYDDWKESSDNVHGGLYINWAFHKDTAFIKENAAQELLNQIKQLIEQAVDEEWNFQQINEIAEIISYK